jgi:hypothetical protein
MSDQRTIDCPICGREVGVPPHVPGRWSVKQRWLVTKLDAVGFSDKSIGRVMHAGPTTIRNLLATMRKGDKHA